MVFKSRAILGIASFCFFVLNCTFPVSKKLSANSFHKEKIHIPSGKGSLWTVSKQSISFSDVEFLDSFFKDLFKNTSAGYVIYGDKPIYLGSFSQPELLIPGSIAHREAVSAFLSLKKLKNIIKASKSSNYSIIIQGIENLSSRNMEFMLINRKALLKVIEENLVLFKYKFGHCMTSSDILDTLNNHGFSKLFGREIALQGIVLGYGADNAISYERIAPYAEAKNFPSFPLSRVPPPPKTEEEMIARLEQNAIEKHEWEKIKEEVKDISYYCPQNSRDNLKIPFSFHQNTKETKNLFINYKKAQAKLDRVLRCHNLLDQIFKDLGMNTATQLFHAEVTLSINEQKMLSQSLARCIQYTFQDQISPEFIEGMKTADDQDMDEHFIQFKEVEFLEILRQQNFSSSTRVENAKMTRQFFQKIARDHGNHCLISNKLYYSILKEGSSPNSIHSNCSNISAHFIIKDVVGNPISGTCKFESPKTLALENLIPGLAHGIIGMKEGEIREIYIHPDFAYGSDSEFGNGQPLQVQMELIEIQVRSDEPKIFNLQPFDVLNFAPNIENCEKFETLQKKYNHLCGMKTWLHYKKIKPLLNFNEIVKEIQNGPQSFTEMERDLISKLNGFIYFYNPIPSN